MDENISTAESMQEIGAPAPAEVSATELLNEESAAGQQQSANSPQPTHPTAPGSAPTREPMTQKSFARRLAQTRERDRASFEQEPAYQLGSMLLQQRMNKDGITAEEAFQRIQSERVTQLASEYAKNPQAAYEAMLRGEMQPFHHQPILPTKAETDARYLADQLIEAKENGALPDGFAPEHINAEFAANAQRYGVEAALQLWNAKHASVDSVVSEMQRRKAAPQPMRPVNTDVQVPVIDFSSMSSEEFRKYDEAFARAARDGRRVTFK